MRRHRTRAGQPRVFVVIPAHNEAGCIGEAIDSLAAQELLPDEVIVAADNCTDETVAVATAHGAQVMETVGNRDKKAGALNQVLDRLLDGVGPDDLVMVLDADTVAAPGFLRVAAERFQKDPTLGAVGGIFHGEDPRSLLEQAQANEYTRYAREIRRTGRVMVLTGTAAVFRVRALRAVATSRGSVLPGSQGRVYNPEAITEDMELTLALKELGWKLVSPTACRTTTELMPTVADLHRQRVRWYRGALDNLRDYGLTPVTRRYWIQQVSITIGTFIFALYLLLLVVDAFLGLLQFNLWWSLVGLVFLVDRVVSAWAGGPRARLLAALVVPEMVYDFILQVAFLTAVREHLRGHEAHWNFDATPAHAATAAGDTTPTPVTPDTTQVAEVTGITAISTAITPITTPKELHHV